MKKSKFSTEVCPKRFISSAFQDQANLVGLSKYPTLARPQLELCRLPSTEGHGHTGVSSVEASKMVRVGAQDVQGDVCDHTEKLLPCILSTKTFSP